MFRREKAVGDGSNGLQSLEFGVRSSASLYTRQLRLPILGPTPDFPRLTPDV